MAKKNKPAAKAAPEPPTDPHVDDVDYEPAPSDEEEDGKTPDRGATPTTNAERYEYKRRSSCKLRVEPGVPETFICMYL